MQMWSELLQEDKVPDHLSHNAVRSDNEASSSSLRCASQLVDNGRSLTTVRLSTMLSSVQGLAPFLELVLNANFSTLERSDYCVLALTCDHHRPSYKSRRSGVVCKEERRLVQGGAPEEHRALRRRIVGPCELEVIYKLRSSQ